MAAETREVGVAQRRVCEIRRVAGRGWPTVAIVMWEAVWGEVRVREVVWRMWVCGMETVITIRRAG